MEGLLERLVELFAQRRISFSQDEGGKVRAVIAQQVGLYEIVQNIFSSIPFAEEGHRGSVETESFVEGILYAAVAYSRAKPPTHRNVGTKIVVESNLPLLDDEMVERLRNYIQIPGDSGRTSFEAKQFGLMAAAALVAEADVADISTVIEGASGTHHKTRIYNSIAAYLSAKRGALNVREVHLQIKSDVAAAQGLLDNFRADFESSKALVRGELDALIAAASQIKSQQTEFLEDIHLQRKNSEAAISENANGFADAVKQVHERLQNFETTAREEMKLESVRLSWEIRFNEARLAFKISCGLLLTYLCLTIGAAYFFGLPVVRALANVEQTSSQAPTTPIQSEARTNPSVQVAVAPETNSVVVAIIHQFGRLIVFSVPVFVWLWVGRALMRYFMRSMLLMDDARQRQTMLDTYFLLSEKGRADERDRPLVLWALFRQTPGHGSDGIDPPDFTEVINAGLKRASGASSS